MLLVFTHEMMGNVIGHLMDRESSDVIQSSKEEMLQGKSGIVAGIPGDELEEKQNEAFGLR